MGMIFPGTQAERAHPDLAGRGSHCLHAHLLTLDNCFGFHSVGDVGIVSFLTIPSLRSPGSVQWLLVKQVPFMSVSVV